MRQMVYNKKWDIYPFIESKNKNKIKQSLSLSLEKERERERESLSLDYSANAEKEEERNQMGWHLFLGRNLKYTGAFSLNAGLGK